jgi:membrane-associated phospholipid phosphatase
VHIAAHYPGDVVAGLLLGAAVSLLGWALLHGVLTAVTGWLRRRPGVGRVFPEPARTEAATPETCAA